MVIGKLNRPIKERLEERVVKRKSGCWEWTGNKEKDGYGRLSIGQKKKKVHRIAYEIYVGPIPPGMLVCHHCDNPPCINPDHLFIGTTKDNSVDMVKKGRSPVRSGENCPTHILKTEQVLHIRKLGLAGVSQAEIARLFNTSRGTIGAILSRKNWKHLEVR